MEHNLKPEVVPKIVDLLGKLPQTKNRLSDRLEDGRQCFCFEGVVCEAYRREHPDTSRWIVDPKTDELLFQVDGDHRHEKHAFAFALPPSVSRWAHEQLLRSSSSAFFEGEGDHRDADGLNDSGTDFPTFIKLLTER